jgi:hypothetical protein
LDVIIREAKAEDAGQLIALVQKISSEPDVDIALSPGEFNLTIAVEQEILAEFAASENSIYLVAEAGGTHCRPAQLQRRQSQGHPACSPAQYVDR